MLRKLITPLAAAALLFGLAGCATATAAAEGTAVAAEAGAATAEVSAPTVAVSEATIVLDVRTPEEYAAGHLEGAVLLDLTSGEFASVLPSLDPDADYAVYCRSGNRSGQAVSMMEQRGMGNVTDLGAMEHAAAVTGLAIVTG